MATVVMIMIIYIVCRHLLFNCNNFIVFICVLNNKIVLTC